ncbi:MAG: phospholipid-binding domain-containing protein [Alphaproteobacteria bacterium]|nr:phospholipid-binding domain-containing protein [Alphaproteobacteria bacterium]|tara:strand:+ start:210 stop:923 length:714 start_codon:yes stop_codon:yes gene_type:complete
MHYLRNLSLSLLAFGALTLQGCTPLGMATGAGAVVGVSAVKEGGLNQSAKDFWISTQISDLWFRYNVDTFSKLDVTVQQGRVLVTGVVQDPEHRVEAIRLAWQPNGVKQVINEIRVAESGGVGGFLNDKWITTQIRAKITLDKEVQSVNYTIDTVQGTVYLMGASHSQAETNKIIEIARGISNVQQVVSYIRLVEEVEGIMGHSSTAPQTSNTQQEYTPSEATSAPMPIQPVDQESL